MHQFDEPLKSSSQFPEPPPLPPKPPFREIVIVYIILSILLIFLAGPLQGFDLLSGLLVTELLLIVGLPVLYIWRGHYPFAASFHLAFTTVPIVILSVLSAVTGFVLIGGIAQLQEVLLPHSAEYQEAWEHALEQFHTLPFPFAWALIALLPGVCEELFFRGFLLHGFREKFSDRGAVVWVAILFGIFHFDPYRFVPVTLLGILFGYLVVKTGSILPAMAAHITNNTIAISLSYLAIDMQEDGQAFESATNELPFIQQFWVFFFVIGGAFIGFVGILWILGKITTSPGSGRSLNTGNHNRLIQYGGREPMEHTEVFDEYPDIVTIRHGADLEITEQHMLETLNIIKERYPEKKLLLVEHTYSYSLSFGAMQFLQNIGYFDRMASVVPHKAMAEHVERSLTWVQFRVPFRVFTDIEAALRFLRQGLSS